MNGTIDNLVILVAIPFGVYYGFHRIRHKRGFAEITKRTGLTPGEPRYLAYCAVAAAVGIVTLILFPPSIESSVREGSAFRAFDGLGFSTKAVVGALVYGVVKTGFAEEFLFRGLIAGSLSRRLSLGWANLAQAVIFLLPHLLILLVSPDVWGILPVVFVGSLFVGWVRIRSGSILGPWLVHAAVNVTVALSVAVRSAA